MKHLRLSPFLVGFMLRKSDVVTPGLMITSGTNTDNVIPGRVIPSNDCRLQVQLTFKHSNVFY